MILEDISNAIWSLYALIYWVYVYIFSATMDLINRVYSC